MDRKRWKAGPLAILAYCVFTLLLSPVLHAQSGRSATGKGRRSMGILIYSAPESSADLAISGLIPVLPSGSIGYVHAADLASLPRVTVAVHGDENFPEADRWQSVQVTGVYLDALARALGVLASSDLIDATCTDGYRAHYPVSYIAQHHPILALTINHRPAAVWAKLTHQRDPGPYFITHPNFAPAFKVLAHSDRPQVPTGVVQLNFTTIAATYGPIAPRGNFAQNSPEEQGFVIAKQNCLRCHNQGDVGGLKAGRTWMTLSTWAREQPMYFENYVHNPKDFETQAKMPASPGYDRATLQALAAYFRTFTATGDYARAPGH